MSVPVGASILAKPLVRAFVEDAMLVGLLRQQSRNEVEMAPGGLDALQHPLHRQRVDVQKRVALHLLHWDQVVGVVRLHAVAWRRRCE